MAIIAGDIDFRLSGGSSNTTPNNSLGGVKSTTEIVDASVANLFDNVSGAESAAGIVEYRCFYVHNNHGTLTLQSAKTFLNTDTPSGDSDMQFALGSSPVNGVERIMATDLLDPMAASAWTGSNDYALADFVEPTTPNGYLYEATADAGLSAASEPTWPTTIGATVVDDGITWTCRLQDTWETAIGEANSVSIGDIAAGQHQAIWMKRTIAAGAAAYAADSAIMEVKGDTAA